ncbi:MAG: hypothetical protein Q9204_007359 [Flavoplaca sp. TL-2023a]
MDGAEGLNGVYVLAATSRPDLIDPALLRPGRLDKSILCDLPNLEDRLDILKAISKNLKMAPEVMDERRQGLCEVAERTEGYSGADLQAVVYNAHLEAIHDQLGDHGMDGAAKKKEGSGRRRDGISRDNILRFRFGGDDEDTSATEKNKSRAQELVEYDAIISKLEDLKNQRRVERQRRRQFRDFSMADAADPDQRTKRGKEAKDVEVVIQWRHIEASLATTRSSISVPERERLGRFYREFVQGRNGEMLDGEGSTEVGGRSSLM